MKKYFLFLILLVAVTVSETTYALVTEVSVSYNRKKTSFDQLNYVETESSTASLSFYIAERIALELSYTSGLALREESVTGLQQTIVQRTQVADGNIIFVFADKKAFMQPYIKGGVAQITRKQEVKINSLDTYVLEPETALAPSYGIGTKFQLTDSFGIKLSYDVWQTPIGDGIKSDDNFVRAGVTWMF